MSHAALYPPQGRDYSQYLAYLQAEAETHPVQANRILPNVTVATRFVNAARSMSGLGSVKSDEVFVYAMKALHFLAKGELLKKSDRELAPSSKAEIRMLFTEALRIAEDVRKEGGGLGRLHHENLELETSQSAMREALLKQQAIPGEVGESERGPLNSGPAHLNAAVAEDESARQVEHAHRREEIIARRHAEAAAKMSDFTAALTPQASTGGRPPASSLGTNEAHMLSLHERLGGIGGIPPAPQPTEVISAVPSGQLGGTHSVPPVANISPINPSGGELVSKPAITSPTGGNFVDFFDRPGTVPVWAYTSAGTPSRVGLRNLGNTCYMNSVIQCLYTIAGLRKVIGEESYVDDLHFGESGNGRVINSLASVFTHMNEGCRSRGPAVNPSGLKNAIGERNESFAGYSQQDASELFLSLINEVHGDVNCKRWFVPTAPPPTGGPGPRNDMALAVESARSYFGRNSLNSVIPRTFMFQTRSLTQCLKCGSVSKVINTEMSLELPFPSSAGTLRENDVIDINLLLREYCRKEKFQATSSTDSKNGYKCETCNHYVSAHRQTTIFSLPQVLTLTMKRFKSYGNFSDKISCCVAFPEILRMEPYTTTASSGTFKTPATELIIHQLQRENFGYDAERSYLREPKAPSDGGKFKLIGVVNHRGNIHGGHYTADVYDEPRHSWARISDEVSTAVDRPDRGLAYMLFYEMV